MLNKPINPYPCFNRVDSNMGFVVECTIPKGKIHGASLYVYDNDTDKLVYGDSITNETPSENISFNVDTKTKIENGRDYYWNMVYFGSEPTEKQTAVISRDSLAGTNTIYVRTDNSVVWNGGKSAIETYRWTSNTMHIYKSSGFYKFYESISSNPSNYGMEITTTDGDTVQTNYYSIKSVTLVNNYSNPYIKVTFNETLFGYVHDDYSLKLYDVTKGGLKPNSIVNIGNYSYTINSVGVANGSMYAELNESLMEDCLRVDSNTGAETTIHYAESSNMEYNNSPDYYFMARSTPTFQVVSGDVSTQEDGSTIDNVLDIGGALKAPQGVFNVKYIQNDGNIDLDYFYYNVWKEEPSLFESQYKLVYQSPKYSNISYVADNILDSELKYKGFAYGSNYYIECIGVDKNGCSITSDRLDFSSSYRMYSADLNKYIKCSDTSVVIDMQLLLLHEFDNIPDGCIYVYRQKRDSNDIEFAGKCLVKDGACDSNYFDDFVVSNHTDYSYIFSVCKGIPSKPYKTIQSSVYTHTDFNGAYIASILTNTTPDDNTILSGTVKGSRGDYIINTKDSWALNLKFQASLSPITYNLSREKVNGFGKYYKVLQGSMEAISSNEQYLLGNMDDECSYFEVTAMQQSWRDFVQNGKSKFYRPFAGEPMMIDIMSFSLQPASYSNGIVNELSFEYIQTGNCNDIQIQIH